MCPCVTYTYYKLSPILNSAKETLTKGVIYFLIFTLDIPVTMRMNKHQLLTRLQNDKQERTFQIAGNYQKVILKVVLLCISGPP